MQVSYGPPGLKGVTHLMAVGADELPANDLEKTVAAGTVVGLGVLLLGILVDSRRLRNIGVGATASMGYAYYVGRRQRRVLAA